MQRLETLCIENHNIKNITVLQVTTLFTQCPRYFYDLLLASKALCHITFVITNFTISRILLFPKPQLCYTNKISTELYWIDFLFSFQQNFSLENLFSIIFNFAKFLLRKKRIFLILSLAKSPPNIFWFLTFKFGKAFPQ